MKSFSHRSTDYIVCRMECIMNINEIAKMAGVSRATVSRYLNDGYVSEEKKQQIRRVIEETGYKPSVQARQLRSGQSRLIGVIIPKINSDSIGRMVAGISQVLAEKGYQLLLGNTDNHEKEELKYMKLFQASHVDGIILIGTILTKEHYKCMKQMDVPVVVLGQQAQGYSCVYYDDYHAARDVTQRLLKKARHAGYIGVTKKDQAAGKDRCRGFLDAVAAWKEEMGQQAEFDPERDMAEALFRIESGYEQMKQLLTRSPEVDAVFCATDNIAIGAMTYLREQRIRVPKQIRLAGIGDTVLGQVSAVGLTTVHYYYKTSGVEAANMLLGILESGKDIRREVKMGYKVIVRDSVL